jgi:four helix bundle protein
MLSQFRTYKIAVEFHHSVRSVALPFYLKDQMLRASSSIALNLGEGSSKPTRRDQLKFYHIALASLRECQARIRGGRFRHPKRVSVTRVCQRPPWARL